MQTRVTIYNKKKNFCRYFMILIIFIGFIGSIPYLFSNDIYYQDDYVFHITRMESYTNSVRNLDFFPKIFYEYANGGGYGVDIFYPSLFLLPYAFLRILGFSTIHSLNVFYFILNCLIATTSFF